MERVISQRRNNLTNEKGQFIRIHKLISTTCPCGDIVDTSEDRVKDGRGKYCSKKCMYKFRVMQTGDKHYKWSGVKPKYSALHKWITKTYGQPMECEWCGFESENKYQIQWANKTGEYKRDKDDWLRLCAKCHYAFDRKGVAQNV